jgi:arginyl-tRNA synthetase
MHSDGLNLVKSTLLQHLIDLLQVTYPQQIWEKSLLHLEVPPDNSFGDYAFPCFPLAKMLKLAPPVIAQRLEEEWKKNLSPLLFVEHIIAKGGHLNFMLSQKDLVTTYIPLISDKSFFDVHQLHLPDKDKHIMLEFSQPNTHKEFHVGHGRNVCLGDSLQRLYRYFGYKVTAVNYIGDEGAHIAKCLYQVEQYQVQGHCLPDGEQLAEWLGQQYVESNLCLEEAQKNPVLLASIQKRISQILADIEQQRDPIYSLWKNTRNVCLKEFQRIYQWLHVHFDHVFYESETSQASQKVVDDYTQKGLFVNSQGAIGMPMEEANLGFMMVRKSDGNTLYITKDIVLAERKFRDFKVDKSLYIVGNEQEFHFRQLFHFLKKANFPQADNCYHLSYGMVRRASGKMSSRKGNSFTFMELTELLKQALEPFLDKYKTQWTTEQLAQTADTLAIGAIKYGMLNTDPKKDIVFEPQEWAQFEGNSGPYLLYAYARARSLIEKGLLQGCVPHLTSRSAQYLSGATEKHLLLELSRFQEVCFNTLEQYRPSLLAHYLFQLCQLFNHYYAHTPVLKDKDKESIESKLILIECFANSLKQGLFLLGIETVEKM